MDQDFTRRSSRCLILDLSPIGAVDRSPEGSGRRHLRGSEACQTQCSIARPKPTDSPPVMPCMMRTMLCTMPRLDYARCTLHDATHDAIDAMHDAMNDAIHVTCTMPSIMLCIAMHNVMHDAAMHDAMHDAVHDAAMHDAMHDAVHDVMHDAARRS